ncbi:MAG TPA: AtpZ/AtpI family protein [Burkholderiales bacterium]|nr:AtpZ/AtpI family protein [Burkholderiales bacterium]
MSDEHKRDGNLQAEVERQARRYERARRESTTILAQTVFLGTLGGLFVLPVVVGAYFGNWLDDHAQGYSIHWTIIMILVGLIVGATNVYLFIKKHD